MSGVVLRCPHCGTVKASPGECEACSEAQVRYYCTNHSPGRWLDAPACPQCGSRFGDPEKPKPAPSRVPPTRPEPSRPEPFRPPAPERRAPPVSAPSSPFAPPAPSRSPWGRGRVRIRPAPEESSAPFEAGRRRISLPELLRTARRGREPDRLMPERSGSLVGAFIRRLVFLGIFFIGAMLLLGILGGGPLLEILLNLLINSGGF